MAGFHHLETTHFFRGKLKKMGRIKGNPKGKPSWGFPHPTDTCVAWASWSKGSRTQRESSNIRTGSEDWGREEQQYSKPHISRQKPQLSAVREPRLNHSLL